jgi:Bacterial dnaA protein helix-turn-helix
MHASLPFPSDRCPPEQLDAFTWIVETAVAGANELRGEAFHVAPEMLFRPPVRGPGKAPRLLAAHLARELLGWPHRTLYAVFHPASSSGYYDGQLAFLARKWVRQGCLDQLSGCSLTAIRERVINGFPYPARPPVQNLSANEPPDPPPRHRAPLSPSRRRVRASPPRPAPQQPVPAITADQVITTVAHYFGLTQDELLSRSRRRAFTLPRQIGMHLARQLAAKSLPVIARRFNRADHTTVLHAIGKITRLAANDNVFRDELAFLANAVETYSRTGLLPPVGAGSRLVKPAFRHGATAVLAPAPYRPDGLIADAPFVRQLHWRLVRSARLMGDSNRQFIAELISDAIDARSSLALKPELFAEVLAHAAPELPGHLAPYAALITEKLFGFTASRSKTPAPALRAAMMQPA